MRKAAVSLVPVLALACGGALGGAGGGGVCAGHALPGLAADHLLIGLSTSDDAIAAKPGFDLRYQYIAGGLSDGPGPCTSLCAQCTSAGASCANSAGCAWWGCWQWDQLAPGEFASGFVD